MKQGYIYVAITSYPGGNYFLAVYNIQQFYLRYKVGPNKVRIESCKRVFLFPKGLTSEW